MAMSMHIHIFYTPTTTGEIVSVVTVEFPTTAFASDQVPFAMKIQSAKFIVVSMTSTIGDMVVILSMTQLEKIILAINFHTNVPADNSISGDNTSRQKAKLV